MLISRRSPQDGGYIISGCYKVNKTNFHGEESYMQLIFHIDPQGGRSTM